MVERKRVIPLAVLSETRWVEVPVTSPWAGAGEAVSDSTDSTEATLRNIGAHPFEFQIGSGQWQRLELRNSVTFLISLASTTVRLRRAEFGGESMARLEISSLTSAYEAAGHEVALGDGSGDSSRPPAPYAVSAVHFDQAYSQNVNSLSCVDSALISFSFWVKIRNGYGYRPICETTLVVDPEEELTITTASLRFGDNRLVFGFGDGVDPENAGESTEYFEAAMVLGTELSDNEWHHVIGSIRTDRAEGQKVAALYIDDQLAPMVVTADSNSFVPAMSGRPFQVGGWPMWDNDEIDLAEFWFAVGQTLLVDFDIPLETRRKFIDDDGWPVDLGANGQTPTGTAPTVFVRRSADNSIGFLTNLGTGGGPFVANGEGSMTIAPTSPSDTPPPFVSPLIKGSDLIKAGYVGGSLGRLPGPANSGTFALHCVNGVLTWVPVP